MSKRILLAAAVLATAVAVFVSFTLPPRRQQLAVVNDASDASGGTIAGILHVHTNRSDGRSAPDDIARAAAGAGLKFVVFTDHGDATRTPDPPQYRSGVLCIDGVEISTNQGHYVAIGLPTASYPLAGDARDVVEDVRRLGGFGIAAHPDSPNAQLSWRDWTAPFDGIELLNADTSWRMLAYEPGIEAKRRLVTAILDYPFRPAETIANEIRDSRSIPAWQALAARRPVVSIAGVDAHAKLQLGGDDNSPYSVPIFGYPSAFRLMSVHVATGSPFTGNAVTDAGLLLAALRAGHLYSVVDGLATPAAFEWTGANSNDTVQGGDELEAGGGVSLHVRSNAPSTYTTVVHRGTGILASARDASDWTIHGDDKPAVYWVEIVAPHQPQPIVWLRSNPIYVRARTVQGPPVYPETHAVQQLFGGSSAEGWQVEFDAGSQGAVDLAGATDGKVLAFRYALAGGKPISQHAALVYPTPGGVAAANRLSFTIRAEHPMRISVQLRAKNADRWQRSLYVDGIALEHAIAFDDMTPVGTPASAAPPLADIASVMLVVDLTNNPPASSGRLWLADVRFERSESGTPPRP